MKQRLGPIKETGVQVIHGQLKGSLGGVACRQLRTGKQVLVYQNRPVSLSLVAEVAAYREVKADGVPVNSQGLNEVFDRLVRIVGKEKLQTIPNRIFVINALAGTMALLTVAANDPAGGNRYCQKQPVKHHIHYSVRSFSRSEER